MIEPGNMHVAAPATDLHGRGAGGIILFLSVIAFLLFTAV